MKSSLVHVDERIVVVNKAPGISLATPRSSPDSAVERLLESIDAEERQKWGIASEDLRLVHRLDSGTTGLVLLARDPETHKELSAALQTRSMAKTYLALVWGHPHPPEGRYDSSLAPDPSDRRRMKPDDSGRPAHTRYRTLARRPHVSLLELHPETGRTHQLRVHTASHGHWIVGDDLYCGARHRGIKNSRLQALLDPPHLLLHAWRISLPAAGHAAGMVLEAPLPRHFLTVLQKLGIQMP